MKKYERDVEIEMEAIDILENSEHHFVDFKENDNKYNFVIDEGNIQEYAEDISTFIDKYIEKYGDDEE